ncbi:glutathione S-transferase P-like [Dendronephthya gigantea]|uniref:glutathione S-transferase P-like n=1 Tax=Dendronephthya gigantea TaxID=151771 RepID=UPI00106B7CCE|nr:glutathione S-transferase P-like [Dendronephthya gigantea]
MALGTQLIFGFIAAIIALYYSGRSKVLIDSLDKAIFGSYGCVSAPNIEELTLQYFKTRGRAESIRMILQDNNIPYSEVNFNKDEWVEIKKAGIKNGVLTFGQVPAITTKSGFSLVQSMAIVHYIGRSLGMDCECDDYHLCEVIALGSEDLRMKLNKVFYDPNFSISSRNSYVTDILPTWLGYFEKLASSFEKESNQSYFIGDHSTWIDYIMFELIDMNTEFDILEDFPKLKNFYETFLQRPNLQKYLVSPARLPYRLPYPPRTVVETKTS